MDLSWQHREDPCALYRLSRIKRKAFQFTLLCSSSLMSSSSGTILQEDPAMFLRETMGIRCVLFFHFCPAALRLAHALCISFRREMSTCK